MGMTRTDVSSVQRIKHSPVALWFFRGCWIFVFLFSAVRRDVVQTWVDQLWNFLQSNWMFTSVYFETWWTALVYMIYTRIARFYSVKGFFDRFKLNPAAKFEETNTWIYRLVETVHYCIPLMLLDTFLVKKYKGVGIDPDLWTESHRNIVQVTRVLPRYPPQIEAIVCQLILALVIYDAMFYVVHFMIHKNTWLYKNIHATHHIHGDLGADITNLLSVPERYVLVLSANEALKLVSAHPFTRLMFVPVFIGLLIENHSAYDFPWSYDKLLPPGVAGGAFDHYQHHMNGNRHYQPFLTYLDKLFTAEQKRKKAT